MVKINLFGKTLPQIQEICGSLHIPKYTAQQICVWMYQKHSRTFDVMTNLSKTLRERLSEQYEIHVLSPDQHVIATDGTKKYLFHVQKGFVESALIPDEERLTLCLSTQAGCKRACVFCCTGKQGWQGDLTTEEILGQYAGVIECDTISNIVYMGMGEPMDNLSVVLQSIDILTSSWGYAKSINRITVSTVGILPELEKFLISCSCPLAISLHATNDEQRHQILPGVRSYRLDELITLLKKYKNPTRKITFEYIVLEGYNNTIKHVNEMARLLNGLRCHINLIPFHPFPNSQFIAPAQDSLLYFQKMLQNKGLMVTIRQSRGCEIGAACGLLSTKRILQQEESL